MSAVVVSPDIQIVCDAPGCDASLVVHELDWEGERRGLTAKAKSRLFAHRSGWATTINEDQYTDSCPEHGPGG